MFRKTAMRRTVSSKLFIIAALILVAGFGTAFAQDDWVPTYHPEMTVSRAAGEIHVDGVLDDAGWRGAAKADNFAEHNPGDQTQPPVDTEAYLTYDDDNLYVAFVCYDDAEEVRADFCDRDRIFGGDYVIFCLDTFGDAVNAFEIAVNPYGIPGDLYYSANNGEDSGFDMIFKSAAQILPDRWIVEMEIPFSSLRFPNVEEQVWKVDFWRNRARESREQYSWAAYDRDDPCWLCKWGTVRGVNGVKSGHGIELLPAFVGHQAAERLDDGEFDNGPIEGEVSLSGKYAVSSNITAEFALNPDFSQVEADAAQIDVNTNFALFYNERRPFFQEGADLFDSWFNAVYTRSINDPIIAGKVTGRAGKTRFALLTARDEHTPVILPFEEHSEFVSNGKSTSNVLRVQQELADQTSIGFIGTDRRYDNGGSGTLIGLDSRIKLNQNYRLELQYLQTYTEEIDDAELSADIGDATFDDGKYTADLDGEEYDGHALYASFERGGRHWWFDFDYWDRSPTFRADNGFETSNNRRTGAFSSGYNFRFDDSELLQSMGVNIRADRDWNYNGLRKGDGLSLSHEFNLRKAQLSCHSQFMKQSELYDGAYFANIWAWHTCVHSRPSNKVSCGGSANYGHRVVYGDLEMGRQTDLSCWIDYKPIDRIMLETSWRYSQSKDLYDDELYFNGYTLWSRLTCQISRELSMRMVIQYNNFAERWEADPLLTYRINPFSIFYIGSTRDYNLVSPNEGDPESWRLTDRQYFVKLQYLFQL